MPLMLMFLGMWGGQGFLAARRFIMPVVAAVVGVIWHLINHQALWWTPLPLLGLMGILTIGYGEHSWIHEVFPVDWKDRLIYGFLCSIPLILTAVFCEHWIVAGLCMPCLIAAFEVRAGKLGRIGSFDILWEDIVRYLTIGILCVVVVL